MEKIQELVEDGKLSKTLMADKKFVEGAEKIFKDENIEIDDKKLAELMSQIETNIKNSSKVSDDKLTNVAGGVRLPSSAQAVKWSRKAVVAASIAAGATLGNVLSGDVIEAASTRINSVEDTNLINHSIGIGGIGVGVYAGFKLGQYIADNMGLKEENQSVKSES
jgi:hypothetical protein